jgi:hypothetical protein
MTRPALLTLVRQHMLRVAVPLFIALALAACSKTNKNKEVCQQTAEQYAACTKAMLGEDMYQLVKSKEKEAVELCTGDHKAVAMYEKCLLEKDCGKFNSCMVDASLAKGP